MQGALAKAGASAELPRATDKPTYL